LGLPPNDKTYGLPKAFWIGVIGEESSQAIQIFESIRDHMVF